MDNKAPCGLHYHHVAISHTPTAIESVVTMLSVYKIIDRTEYYTSIFYNMDEHLSTYT